MELVSVCFLKQVGRICSQESDVRQREKDVVDSTGGFLKWVVPPNHPFWWDSLNKPSSYWGTPMTMETTNWISDIYLFSVSLWSGTCPIDCRSCKRALESTFPGLPSAKRQVSVLAVKVLLSLMYTGGFFLSVRVILRWQISTIAMTWSRRNSEDGDVSYPQFMMILGMVYYVLGCFGFTILQGFPLVQSWALPPNSSQVRFFSQLRGYLREIKGRNRARIDPFILFSTGKLSRFPTSVGTPCCVPHIN